MLETIKTRLNVIFPEDVTNVVLEFCDVFDVLGKRERLNFIVKTGYDEWITEYLSRGAPSEKAIKELIWYYCKPHLSQMFDPRMHINNYYHINNWAWVKFLKYFHDLEK